MRLFFYLADLLLIVGCNSKNNQNTLVESRVVKAKEVGSNASISNSQYRPIKHDLFIDGNGNVAYRAYDQSIPNDTRNRFITTMYLDTSVIELRFVIDTATFKHVGDLYYRDKNYVYYHFPMMDGGSFYIIEEADRNSIQVFGLSWYAKDKNHIFCRGSILDIADYKTFSIRPLISNGDTVRWLGKDKHHVYDSDDTLDQQTLEDWNVKL